MRRKFSLFALLVPFIALCGCGAGSVSAPAPVDHPQQPGIVSFSANPTSVHPGDAVTLTWSVQNAQSVSIDGIGNVASSGSAVVHPQQTTVYTITVVDQNSKSTTQTARVEVVPSPGANAITGVLTWKGDQSRLGLYDTETQLTPANVNVQKFGKRAERSLDGLIMAQPLYVRSLEIPGQGAHNVVIAATEHASIYAFDADKNSATPFWKRNFLPTGWTTMPDNFGGRSTFDGEVGITGTPTIDPATGNLYLVSYQQSPTGTVEQWLHEIDIRTGADVNSVPIDATKIEAFVAGDGEASVDGRITFDPMIQNQRPGLLLLNGVVYIAWGSFSDHGAFHGWVMAYDASTLQQTAVFNSATKYKAKDIGGDHGGGASFWAGGAGITADPEGNIYIVSGDGTFSADIGDPDYGNSVLKLRLAGNQFNVIDWFTPANQECFNAADLEIGSGGIAILPDSVGNGKHLIASVSKEGRVYLLDRDNLGHIAPNDSQIPQQFMVGDHTCVLGVTTGAAANDVTWNRLYGNLSYWNGNVYMGASAKPTVHYKFDGSGKLNPTPASQASTSCGNRGCNTVVSSNGIQNAILWSYEKSQPNGIGVLHAYDAQNLANELWNSNMNASRDAMKTGIGFMTPVVADGHVFAAYGHALVTYGSLP